MAVKFSMPKWRNRSVAFCHDLLAIPVVGLEPIGFVSTLVLFLMKYFKAILNITIPHSGSSRSYLTLP